MYSTHTYQCRREHERIYKLYNKNFIVLQLDIEHIQNELCHYWGPLLSVEWRHRHAVTSTSGLPIPSCRYWPASLGPDCPLRGDVTDGWFPLFAFTTGLPVTMAVRFSPGSWPWPGRPELVVSETPLLPSGPARLGRDWLVVWSAGPSRMVTSLWLAAIPW